MRPRAQAMPRTRHFHWLGVFVAAASASNLQMRLAVLDRPLAEIPLGCLQAGSKQGSARFQRRTTFSVTAMCANCLRDGGSGAFLKTGFSVNPICDSLRKDSDSHGSYTANVSVVIREVVAVCGVSYAVDNSRNVCDLHVFSKFEVLLRRDSDQRAKLLR